MRWLLALALALAARCALAACTATAVPVSFGPYNPVTGEAVENTGRVDVSCVPAASYTILLSTGFGSYAAREMVSGPDRLAYNLYTDYARTTVWGDGAGGSLTVGGTAGLTAVSHTVYGRIPGGQTVRSGAYADTVLVTVNF
jgi:spore coat protein U domain-containing protein, fimbrial subunit CupE1/2/3/6